MVTRTETPRLPARGGGRKKVSGTVSKEETVPDTFSDTNVPRVAGVPGQALRRVYDSFTPGSKDTFRDEKRKIVIKVLARKGDAWEIAVSNGQ